MATIRENLQRFKIWITAALVGVALIVVVQNAGAQKIRVLFWQPSVSLSLALIAMAGIGFLIGFLLGARKARVPK